MAETLPCITLGARSIRQPKCCPIAWWPRQTPSKGRRASAQAATRSSEMPAPSGVPGPGEISTASAPLAKACRATVIADRHDAGVSVCYGPARSGGGAALHP